jgi:hypothetical protein
MAAALKVKIHSLQGSQSNNSLDRSGGSVFRIKTGAAMPI